jgi:hypothetical protein
MSRYVAELKLLKVVEGGGLEPAFQCGAVTQM